MAKPPYNDPYAITTVENEVNRQHQRQLRTTPPPCLDRYENRILEPAAASSRQRQQLDDDNGDEDRTTSSPPPPDDAAQLRSAVAALQTLAVSDAHFTPRPFKGTPSDAENVKQWLHYFYNYCQFRQIIGEPRLQLFKLLVQDNAADWMRTLPRDVVSSMETLLAAFKARYKVRYF